jgi:elongator complex protein 3
MREFGVTRVELGVQMPDDKIYKLVKRGHRVRDVVASTKALKDAGFKVGYHIMPGLPGSNMKKDLQLFKKLFSDEKFKPDQLKIYPCQVIKGSKLEEQYWKKKYRAYNKEQIEKLLSKMLKLVPRYCRVMRVMREIPPDYLVAGTTRIDLRKDVEKELRNEKEKIKEIRFREIGFNQSKLDLDLEMKITKYSASGGKEYFLEIVNKDDILFGLLRLRIVNNKAIIRELHVYGQSLKLGEKGKIPPATSLKSRGDWEFREIAPQHRGFGKMLMNEAEKIVKKEKIKKISVISGIGVREYYRTLGYELEDTYMIKDLI